jgi:hypothetical protein
LHSTTRFAKLARGGQAQRAAIGDDSGDFFSGIAMSFKVRVRLRLT